MARNDILPYEPGLKKIAQTLRKNMTHSEVLLWQQLRKRKLGYQFHRQVPIDQFIVDFFCHELKLAIEVDGGVHKHPEVSVIDLQRQKRIEAFGVHFLRFENREIKQDIGHVLEVIKDWIILNEIKITS